MPRQVGQTPTSMRASDDLPEALGPMMPSPLPAVSSKAHVLHGEPLPAGRARAGILDRQDGRGAPAASAAASGRGVGREQGLEPAPALAGADEALPVADRQLDRRQAREVRIELAIMMPPVAWPSMTR